MDAQDTRSPATGTFPATPARRRRLLWAGAALVALLAGAFWLAPRQPDPPAAPPVVQSPPPAEPALEAPPVEPPPAQIAAPVQTPKALVRKPAPVVRPADGQVMLAIAPWGEVLVNGERRGVSPPMTKMSLAPGSYTIEVRNGDAPPLRTSIEIKAGQTQTLRHRF